MAWTKYWECRDTYLPTYIELEAINAGQCRSSARRKQLSPGLCDDGTVPTRLIASYIKIRYLPVAAWRSNEYDGLLLLHIVVVLAVIELVPFGGRGVPQQLEHLRNPSKPVSDAPLSLSQLQYKLELLSP